MYTDCAAEYNVGLSLKKQFMFYQSHVCYHLHVRSNITKQYVITLNLKKK